MAEHRTDVRAILPELPPELDEAGQRHMREKATAKRPEHETFGHMSDEWVANGVRMLMRNDLWHEAFCTAGRDRIMRLSLEVARLKRACAKLEGTVQRYEDAHVNGDDDE